MSMHIGTLRQLYLHTLQDLYSAEEQLAEAMPEMAEAVTSEDLRTAFEEHATSTREHAARLEGLIRDAGDTPGGVVCRGMGGLVAEGREIIKDTSEPSVRDAGLIAAAQKIEHYEISGYGTARAYAQLLGETDAAQVLQTTLDEEADTDIKLSHLAEESINMEAAATTDEAAPEDTEE